MRVSHVGFHKDVFKPSLLKSTAVFLVFVFAWTNMGLYQAVYAATTSSNQHPAAQKQNNSLFGKEGPGEISQSNLESLIKRIRERAEKVENRSQAASIESEKAEFLNEKSELEQTDISIRAQFKQTEAKIKNLPPVIQQRQKAFERKYEKNFAQLKSELDSINTAKTNTQFRARTRKLKVFLDKIKPPERHIKFNPNKLPHRMMKPIWREPRMNYGRQRQTVGSERNEDEIPLSPPLLKGEMIPLFEKEGLGEISHPVQLASLKDSSQYRAASSEGNNTYSVIPAKAGIQSPVQLASLTTDNLGFSFPPLTKGEQGGFDFVPSPLLGEGQGECYSPIQLASLTTDNLGFSFPTLTKGQRGGFDFVPSPLAGEGQGEGSSPVQVASIGSLKGILSSAIVQTIPPPTATDLTSTVEVQFTPAILAKAKELGYNAVNIYNWVYNNIEYVPTYGSIQGADLCLQTMQCNDMDTANLLIALLRASNIPARYVYGTIQLPIAQVMNWVGGFTDPMSAGNLIASGGIPVKGVVQGGKLAYLKMEHVWVEAYVNYFPSRGARNGLGNEWIPLDASYKQYTYTQGMNITQTVPFDAQSFVNQITSTATINTQQGYVTNINAAYISQTIANYQAQVANYISQTNPNATVGDIIGKKQIIQQNFPYLLGTLPYQVLAKGWEASEVPGNLRYKITFQVTNPQTLQTDINYTVSLPEIAGKKVTLNYIPATSADEAAIESYIPPPNPDGTPLQPSQLPTSLPAYLMSPSGMVEIPRL